MSQLIYNTAVHERFKDDTEATSVNLFFLNYLANSAKAARVIETMSDIIEEFQRRAPRLIVTKCIDGRTHGSKGKGYPPTTVSFSRTEGNIADLKSGNHFFWKRINKTVSQAMHDNNGKPALFIALGHYALKGHGCAAHGLDNEKALATVAAQTKEVRASYDESQLYALHGMTNTDDMSERLIFADGTEIDTTKIIETFTSGTHPLKNPYDIFDQKFIEKNIDDDITDAYVGRLTPKAMMQGNKAPMYNDLQTALAMETYLLREISQAVKNKTGDQKIIRADLFKQIINTLNNIEGLPASLKPALAYQIFWNIAYTLYQRNRLEHMDPEEQACHLEHNEDLVGYGEGFELLPRNEIILVKIGRGDDAEALTVARKVLLNNRKENKKEQNHPPLVHANVEIAGTINTWDDLNSNVLAPLRTMLRTIRDVWGNDARILTTYSYGTQKIFFPVQTKTPEEMKHVENHAFSTVGMTCYPVDVIYDLSPKNFRDKNELDRRERAYTDMIVLEEHKN